MISSQKDDMLHHYCTVAECLCLTGKLHETLAMRLKTKRGRGFDAVPFYW